VSPMWVNQSVTYDTELDQRTLYADRRARDLSQPRSSPGGRGGEAPTNLLCEFVKP